VTETAIAWRIVKWGSHASRIASLRARNLPATSAMPKPVTITPSTATQCQAQSWNMYAYALGDPINYRDPRGLDVVDGDGDVGDNGFDCTPGDFICINGTAGYGGTFGGYYGGCASVSSLTDQPDPWCPVTGGPVTTSQPAQQQPTCSIQLFARPVPNGNSPAFHTYFLVTDSAWGNSGYLVEGGPTGNPVLSSLIGYDDRAPGQGLPGSNPGQPGNIFLGADNAQNACNVIQAIFGAVETYNDGPPATYNFQAAPFTYNSNSFISTLENQFGLSSYFIQPSSLYLWAPGWWKQVPGL